MRLFEPYTINNKLTLTNHIMMPPVVTRLATASGHVTAALIERYMLYARGGAGIVVTEAVSVKKQAGFDAVELHFAHAYTMASFLSRYNKRKDDYGGSLKKRMCLAEEVVKASRKALGDDFVLGARINGDEFTAGGNSLRQSRPIALRLAELGLDYISVSAGGKFEDAQPREGEALDPYTGYSGSRTMPPKWMPEKVNVYLATDIKKTVNEAGFNPTIITAGRILTAEVAEGILQNNEADMVAVGRPILCDPFWPNKFKAGREKDLLKCIYCNECREAEEALVGSGKRYTYAQLRRQLEILAYNLILNGLKPGDLALLQLPNLPEFCTKIKSTELLANSEL